MAIESCEKCKRRYVVPDNTRMSPIFCPPCSRAYAKDAEDKMRRGDLLAMCDAENEQHKIANRISALRDAAGQAGDLVQVAICQIALDDEPDPETFEALHAPGAGE